MDGPIDIKRSAQTTKIHMKQKKTPKHLKVLLVNP